MKKVYQGQPWKHSSMFKKCCSLKHIWVTKMCSLLYYCIILLHDFTIKNNQNFYIFTRLWLCLHILATYSITRLHCHCLCAAVSVTWTLSPWPWHLVWHCHVCHCTLLPAHWSPELLHHWPCHLAPWQWQTAGFGHIWAASENSLHILFTDHQMW